MNERARRAHRSRPKRSTALLAAALVGAGILGGSVFAFEDGTATALDRSLSAMLVPRPVTLVFVGDIMLSRLVGKEMAQRGVDYPYLRIDPTLESADLAFANLESPVSARGANQGSIYSFRADPTAIDGLARAGFDILSVANNHIWDWGPEALDDTVNVLKAHDLHPVGAGPDEASANAPYIADVDGTKIAYVAYTNLLPKSLFARSSSPGLSDFDEKKIVATIAELKRKADIVVVSVHWGVEYNEHATDEQKRLAHEFADAGADLIIGSHPHVVEETEHYNGTWIFYSLGNFVFDQEFSHDVTHGLMVRVTLADRKIASVEEIPISINKDYQPEIATSTASTK